MGTKNVPTRSMILDIAIFYGHTHTHTHTHTQATCEFSARATKVLFFHFSMTGTDLH